MQAGAGGEEAALDWGSLGMHIPVMSCQGSAFVQPRWGLWWFLEDGGAQGGGPWDVDIQGGGVYDSPLSGGPPGWESWVGVPIGPIPSSSWLSFTQIMLMASCRDTSKGSGVSQMSR